MGTHKGVEEEADTCFAFELNFVVHDEDEAEANKTLAKLLDEAERLGLELVWKQPRF